jgi:hypothetical protein
MCGRAPFLWLIEGGLGEEFVNCDKSRDRKIIMGERALAGGARKRLKH